MLALIAIVITSTNLNAQTVTPKINLTIEKEIIIDANIDDAWQLLGPQFTDAYLWASTVSTSEGQGEKIGGIYSERICTTNIGVLTEKVLDYSAENHVLAYSFEGMPKMIRYAQNTWKLTSIDNGKTKLTLVMEIRIGGFIGTIMKPMMRMKMASTMKHTIEEFKFYVEFGKPHPRKVKALHKLNKKNSRK